MTFRLFKLPRNKMYISDAESISKTSPGKTVVLATLPKSARILSVYFFFRTSAIEKSLVKKFFIPV